MNIIVRREERRDHHGVRNVLEQAFGQKREARLVERLRTMPGFIPELSMVAEFENRIIGYILFFPITIVSGEGRFNSLALAPLAVTPSYQRKGVGKLLVEKGLDRAGALGHGSVIVLGHPEYYPAFGFVPASTWGIKAPFDVPDNVFLARELAPGGLRDVSGVVQYPKEFYGG